MDMYQFPFVLPARYTGNLLDETPGLLDKVKCGGGRDTKIQTGSPVILLLLPPHLPRSHAYRVLTFCYDLEVPPRSTKDPGVELMDEADEGLLAGVEAGEEGGAAVLVQDLQQVAGIRPHSCHKGVAQRRNLT